MVMAERVKHDKGEKGERDRELHYSLSLPEDTKNSKE